MNNPYGRPHLPAPPDDDDDYREPVRPLIDRRKFVREDEAQRVSGLSRTTLWTYRKRGWVMAEKRLDAPSGLYRWHYQVASLRIARREAARRKATQRRVAGPGRGRSHSAESLAAARARSETRSH